MKHVPTLFGCVAMVACSAPETNSIERTHHSQSTVDDDDTDATDTGNSDSQDDEPVPSVDCTVDVGDHLPVPQEPSHRFVGSCASCHGSQGEGHEEFVGSIIGIELSVLDAYTRSGLNYGMPGFTEDEYPAALLEYDWAWLNGIGAQLSDGCVDQPMTIPVSTSRETAEQMVQDGLDAWLRMTDEGMSCANCHGPDPVDLVSQGYTVGDLLRRSLLHVNEEAAWDITYGVLASRFLGDIPDQNPEAHRLFQPGGRVIEASTLSDVSDAERRDHAFGAALIDRVDVLGGPPITTREEAEALLSGLAAIDLRQLKVGIPMMRWTVDAIRGNDFRGFGEWIPEVAHVSRTDRTAADVFSEYRDNPSLQELQAMLQWNAEETQLLAREYFSIEPGTLAADVYRAKYASVLLAHHFMRTNPEHNPEAHGMTGTPAFREDDGPWTSGLALNPWWQLSSEAARANTELSDCRAGQICAGFTPDIQVDDVPIGETLQSQVAALQLPWGWLGFMYDNALETASTEGPQASPESYIRHLAESGYINHALFLLLRRNIEITRGGAGWARLYGEGAVPRLASSRADWRGLDALIETSGSTELDTQRVDLLSNGLRAFLWALLTEVEDSGVVHGRFGEDELSILTDDYRVGLDVFELIHGSSWYPTMDPLPHWSSTAAADAVLYKRLQDTLESACDLYTAECP